MKRNRIWYLFSAFLLTGMAFIPLSGTMSKLPGSIHDQQSQPTPAELIDAVNSLRLAYGLPPLSINSILMNVSQNQANYLLETEGGAGHSRANGMSLTDQLLSLGYPLAGDLSLGGYRSENYVFGTGLDVQSVIQIWLGDAPHTNTMLSPNYFDIGGGVAIGKDGNVYYVIDTARHTSSGRQQEYTPEVAGTIVSGITINGTPGIDQFMVPVTLSTPNSGGLVIHTVKYGQTLWSIAIAYKTTIQQIRELNDLPSNDIFSDQKLLIRRESMPNPVASPSPAKAATLTPAVMFSTATSLPRTSTPVPIVSVNHSRDNIPLIATSILAAIIIAGIGFWANKRNN
jgi:LysM repeat protein